MTSQGGLDDRESKPLPSTPSSVRNILLRRTFDGSFEIRQDFLDLYEAPQQTGYSNSASALDVPCDKDTEVAAAKIKELDTQSPDWLDSHMNRSVPVATEHLHPDYAVRKAQAEERADGFRFRLIAELSGGFWSVAISFSFGENKTMAFLDGFSKPEMLEVSRRIDSERGSRKYHPLWLISNILEMAMTYSAAYGVELDRKARELEDGLGIARGSSNVNPWAISQFSYRNIIRDVNTCFTALVYLERRVDFEVNAANQLLTMCTDGFYKVSPNPADDDDVRNDASNNQARSLNHLHHVQTLQKRAHNHLNAVNAIISQRDSEVSI
ncbi:hypothetical protein MMC17_002015 [Xylographa soralifera]|nr:hypothetical protein [Xylographa soralifera]